MPKDVIKKLLLIFISIGILAPITYLTYDGYRKSVAPSVFELAATRLGFNGYKKADLAISTAQEQEALLQQLQIAGYFKPEIYGKLSII